MIIYAQHTPKGIYAFMYEMLWATSHDNIQYDFTWGWIKELHHHDNCHMHAFANVLWHVIGQVQAQYNISFLINFQQ